MSKNERETRFDSRPWYFRGNEPKPVNPKPTEPENPEKTKRRMQILNLLQERFSQADLKSRLTQGPSGEVSVGEVLNQGLLGPLPDETLIEDIKPQGVDGAIPTDLMNMDPLWKYVFEFLDTNQKTNVMSIFKTLRKTSMRLEDESQKEIVSRMLKTDRLTTIGDLRQISAQQFALLAGLGPVRAATLAQAVKKIE